MQQLEWSIPAATWAGLNTKYEPSTALVGPDEFTAGSINYEISPTGSVVKRTDTQDYNPEELDEPIKDEFEMIFTSGERHKLVMSDGELFYTTGDGEFTSVQSGYTAVGNMEFAAYQNRAYFGNGIDDPQVYDNSSTYGGVTYTPPKVKDMGAQAPSSAPTFAADSAGGSVPAGAHTYKVTFLYYGTEESNGGPASASHTVANPNNTVNLTSIPIGGYGVTARKIYRDNGDGLWLLVKTVSDNTSTTASDTAALGTTPIPTDNNESPVWGLVTQYRDRLWVAGVSDAQSTLYYSDAGLPDIWPTNNFIQCNPRDTINALAVYNDKVVVFGKASFGIILGTTSDNFRYTDISPNIGCVDCRSVQIITVRGVPKLQWLSQFGVYQWDGSNLQLISDKIDNLLKFNIQQASGTQQKNIQTTQADFQAGTASPGIDLTDIPGTITTHGYTGTTNPTKQWDTQAEWEAGSSLTNLATRDGSNTLKSVLRHAPTYSTGTVTGSAIVSGSNLQLTAVADFTGESTFPAPNPNSGIGSGGANVGTAQEVHPLRSGTITSITMLAHCLAVHTPATFRIRVWADSSGIPGTVLFDSATFNAPNDNVAHNYTSACVIPVTANQKIWIGTFRLTGQGLDVPYTGNLFYPGTNVNLEFNGTSWINPGGNTNLFDMTFSYAFTQNAVASSGLWTGPIYDSSSVFNSGSTIAHTATYPAGTSALTTVEATNDPLFITGITSFSVASMNSPFGVSTGLTDKQYWRVKIQLDTSDNRSVPVITPFLLKWPTTSTWISDVIDHTADIDTLDDLILDAVTPSGTTAVVTIATSANNITYSSFTAIGMATPERYSKVRVVLTTDVNDTITATVNSVRFDWSLTANLVSSTIFTGTTPAGWGLFQSDYDVNGGTLVFEARTAATEIGLLSATFQTVTNGSTMVLDLFPWIQWRVTITAHANEVPEVRSITLNWNTTTGNSIRVASLFYNQVYYLAAAEYGSDTNNIVLYYDQNGRWGQFADLNINTMGMFFAQPYFGEATTGFYVNWLNPAIITDGDITFDIRTKAYSAELVSDDKTKLLRHMVLEVIDTLAEIQPLYSVDGGMTWNNMVDVVTGLTTYTGVNTGKRVKIRFTPQSQNVLWGYDLMIRLFNEDEFPVTVIGMRAKAYISDRPVLLR